MKRAPLQRHFDQRRADPEGGIAFDTPPRAAGHLATRRVGGGNALLHRVKRSAVSQRPGQRLRGQAGPDGDRDPGLAQPGRQCRCDALLQKEPPERGRALPGCSDCRNHLSCDASAGSVVSLTVSRSPHCRKPGPARCSWIRSDNRVPGRLVAMTRPSGRRDRPIEEAQMSVISRTSPSPAEEILPARIETSRLGSAFGARGSSPKSGTSSSQQARGFFAGDQRE